MTDTPMLTVSDYADHHGLGHRTVQRYISEGRIPGAHQDHRRRWWLPADVLPTLDVATTPDVRPASTDVALAAQPTRSPLGHLGSLEDAAHVLGTTTGGVRRMARDGHLVVGPYGPRGALRVYVAPR